MQKSKRITGLIIVSAFLFNLVFSHACFAQDPTKKLGRGVANLALGWVSLFTTIEDTGKSDGIFAAMSYGVFKGVAKFLQRTAVGLYEIVTFPIPIPKDYKPILTKPEFPLGKEAKEATAETK
jgi:putative exosortase-associated protein (TIGR04073 family)